MSWEDVPVRFQSWVSEDGIQAWLANHELRSVPGWLWEITDLMEVDLSDNRLTAIPESIGNLTALTSLDITGNRLTAIPESIGNLRALTDLGLRDNELTTIPESIGNLTALTSLDLRGNRLTAIPESIGNLTALTSLDLRDNELTTIPESIGNLTALTSLDLRGNRLTAIPESIGNLTAINNLYLARNRLTVVPDSIDNLTTLTELDLQINELITIPTSIANLTALTLLNLSSNHLTNLPRELADPLMKGLLLKLDGNPLDDPLPELVGRGSNALATYLRSLEDAIAQYEAKLLLIGEGEVGKTSLVAALHGAPFVMGRPTTHGIEISPLTFRHPSLDLDMTLRAWDFGGQEVYRVSHQFFFSQRALYLVVWHPRKGQDQGEVEGWLRRIRLRVAHDACAIVVATHCSERQPELDYPSLEREFRGMLVGNFEIDSRTNLGISRLQQAIGRQAALLPSMGQQISPRWVAAKQDILARAEAEPQIRYEDFIEICQLHRVKGQEILTLAQLMHDLGHIIYYGEDEGLKDIVVLNPEWLTKAVSYVLEDTLTREAGGVLDHKRLRTIWEDRADGPAYPAKYHPYFLRLMEKFDISYRLEGELHSLIAQLVPYARPDLPWEPRTQPAAGTRSLALVCRLSESAPGLISWLTVRHHRASTKRHWRRGVFLKHPIAVYASEALLELRDEKELTLEVRAPSPDLYFHVLRDSIEDLIARRWPGLTHELFIPCPGRKDGSLCTGDFPLNKLLQMREQGWTSVPCMTCVEYYEISLLLTGFTGPTEPLSATLDRMQEQLTRIESSGSRTERHASEIAESVRRVLRIANTEITDCPHLFTLSTDSATRAKRLRVDQHHYRLTLWCEHPGYWHPWIPASYELNPPKDWFAKIKPYAMLIFKTLQLVVPVAGSAIEVLLPADQVAHAQEYVKLMSALVADLPTQSGSKLRGTDLGEHTNQLNVAQDQALRAIRAILFEHDPLRKFGGLRRVLSASGDLLWVCENHYPEYDPGLPTVG
jgi:internalin A